MRMCPIELSNLIATALAVDYQAILPRGVRAIKID